MLPAIGANLGTGLLLAGTALAVGGQIQQGRAAEREAKNAAAISEFNAQQKLQEGKAQQQRSKREAEIQQRQGAELQASQRAAFGKAGVTGRGSPLTVQVDTAKQLELDRLTILREGSEALRRSESAAAGERLQASSFRQQGRAARRGSLLAAGGTALTGFGKILV